MSDADLLAKFAKDTKQTVAEVVRGLVKAHWKEYQNTVEEAQNEVELVYPETPPKLEDALIPLLNFWRNYYFSRNAGEFWRGSSVALICELKATFPDQWAQLPEELKIINNFKTCLIRFVRAGRQGVFYADLKHDFKIEKRFK